MTAWPSVPTVCEVCAEPLPSRTAWRRHRQNVHGLTYWAVRCRECDHVSPSAGAAAGHRLEVHG